MTAQDKALAIMFPGQGSQFVGMMADLPGAQDSFAEASEALGLDLWALAIDGPEEALNRTENTQPALLAAGVAAYRQWRTGGGAEPAWLAGHSLGEYTALVCAGALDFRDGAALARLRGQLMQAAVPPGRGAMAAVLGLDDGAVKELCLACAGDEVLAAVNFNAPGQVVVAGAAGAVDRLVVGARAAGARRVLRLSVSVPSHCALMAPAAEKFRLHLEKVRFTPPRIPVLHNVNAQTETAPGAIRELLVRQLYSPVRWVETVQRLGTEGVSKLVECGPGKVLAGLAKRINRNLIALPVGDSESLAAALLKMAEA